MHSSAASCDSVAGRIEGGRQSLIDELTLRGVRLTTQRRVIVETIQDANEHLDAASLL